MTPAHHKGSNYRRFYRQLKALGYPCLPIHGNQKLAHSDLEKEAFPKGFCEKWELIPTWVAPWLAQPNGV